MTTGDMQRKSIFLAARACVGCPFRHQGRIPATGLDCVGLIVHVATALRLGYFDRRDYRKIPGRRAISRTAEQAGFRPVAVSDRRAGDVVILRFGRTLEHAGILSDRGLIHACEKFGRVVEHRLDKDWVARITHIYAFPSIKEQD
tara:strand:- start:956 stop:1390 length:435 start_codon:yes stop_codon:yes gene_type:complete